MNNPVEERRSLLLKIARDNGLLIDLSTGDAESWRKEWRSTLACLCHSFAPKKAAKPRAIAPPREMLQPGTWIAFQPHLTSPEQRCFVVALVPPGTSLDQVLSPLQIGLLERHTCLSASGRYARVVVAIPGLRKAVGCLRPILAGALGARGRVIDPMDSASRLLEPLRPGTFVSWEWTCGGHGRSSYRGMVMAFVPAGVPILDLLPKTDLRLRGGTQMTSIQDRYATISPSGVIHFPPAFAIERNLHGLPAPALFPSYV